MAKIIVIGGGAAGMMAAIAAGESGHQVQLYEKNEKLGKKIFITGKGRCNVTNAGERDDFFSHIVTNPKFLYSSFGKWSNWDMYDFLERNHLPLKIERGNRVFPSSDKSSDVIKALQHALDQAHVSWHLNCGVKKLILEENAGEEGEKAPSLRCCGVVLDDGTEKKADRVIAATGGLSYPSTGSTGDGYRWAREAGHHVSELYPALVPFDAVLKDGSSCRELQGLALKNVGVRMVRDGKELASDFGEMLFTHFGVSGPVILSASNLVTSSMDQGEIQLWIDLKPALSEEQLDVRLLRELELGANKQMKNLLGTLFPAKLIPVMLRYTGISPEKKGREITREERSRLLHETKYFQVRLLRTRSFREAIITQGGISVKEIQPSTMESKLVKGLHFAGEVLDVEGFTGGYNLQIAWSTGYAAGKAGDGKKTR
ncbi:MAG: NAD(P)/FAD-dependent oxidoreductase [Clostridiales bacterium]|nr:NAD(P)/FAD-dependent oxidoreductase [Clostridiales bacterium]